MTATIRRAKVNGSKSPTRSKRMGKKRAAITKKPRTPRELFAARLRELAGDRTAAELAKVWGVSADAAGLYLSGKRVPKLDDWPTIAKAFGLSWTDLLPPQ